MPTTTAGLSVGSCRGPKVSKRSHVSRSSDSPRPRSNSGEANSAALTSALASTASVSRVRRPIVTECRPPRSVHPDQAADRGTGSGLGLWINTEDDAGCPEGCDIGAARRQRMAGAGEVVEAPLELPAVELDLLAFAGVVEPFHCERAAAFRLEDRRGAVDDRLRERRIVRADAAHDGGCDLAGLPRRRLGVSRVAIDDVVLEVGTVDLALAGADREATAAADRLAAARFQIAQHQHTVGTELDDLSRRDIVHHLGAGDLTLNLFDQGDGRGCEN